MYDSLQAIQERQDAICARANIHVDRRTQTAHRHIVWMLVLAIIVSPVAFHIGDVATWAVHVGASWDHLWSQAAAYYKQLHQVSGQLARQNGAGAR